MTSGLYEVATESICEGLVLLIAQWVDSISVDYRPELPESFI